MDLTSGNEVTEHVVVLHILKVLSQQHLIVLILVSHFPDFATQISIKLSFLAIPREDFIESLVELPFSES